MSVKPSFETPFFTYITELHRAVHAVGLFLDGQLDGKVSQPEALIIMHLSGRSASTINELHHAFLHRRSTLTSVLDRLESKGLVQRRSAGADRRNVEVKLTVRGMRVADAIARAFNDLSGEVKSSITISEPDLARVRAIAEQASKIAHRGDR